MNTQPTTNQKTVFTTLINYAQKVWTNEISGEYCETYLNAMLSGYVALLDKLTNNRIQPCKIIGSGYKNPRKSAFDYLNSHIAECTNYVNRKEIHPITISNYFFNMAKICVNQGVTVEQKEYFLEIYKQYKGVEFAHQIKVIEPTLDELKAQYLAMPLDDLRRIKKEKYSNMDITTAMPNDEKAIVEAIAIKFAELNQKVKEKRQAGKDATNQPQPTNPQIPTGFTESPANAIRKDGKRFFESNNYQIVEKADKTAYVTRKDGNGGLDYFEFDTLTNAFSFVSQPTNQDETVQPQPTQPQNENPAIAKIVNYTQDRVDNWYSNVKEEYGIIGNAQVLYHEPTDAFIIKGAENSKKTYFSISCRDGVPSIDYVFNVWMEEFKVVENSQPEPLTVGQSIQCDGYRLVVTAVKEAKQAETQPAQEPASEPTQELSTYKQLWKVDTEGAIHLSQLSNLAYRAYLGTSMSPEKRASDCIKSYDKDLIEFLAEIPAEHQTWVKAKYISLFTSWLSAKSRCISSFITGPSNFPVSRAQKYNNWEHGAYETFIQWKERTVKRLNRKEKLSIDLELIETENTIEQLKANQQMMKDCNKVVQSKKMSNEEKIEELENLGLSKANASKLLTPDYCNRLGFRGFELTNNNARIKHYEEKLAKLQNRINARSEETKETTINGVRIVENIEADRLQIFFDGIPAENIRKSLKSNGFRWSPSNGCWQSYLQSGKYKISYLVLS